MRFLCKVPSLSKLSTFLSTTALQHCKLILSRFIGWRGGRWATTLPFRRRRDGVIAPYQCGDHEASLAYDRFTVLLSVPFSFQFCGWEGGFITA